MSRRSAPGPVRTGLGWLGVAAGTALLLGAAAVRANGIAWQEEHVGAFPLPGSPDEAQGSAPAREPIRARRGEPERGQAMARLRLARLGIDTVVVEGTDARSLRLGPGHMAGTALPGDPDNCIIAGHRDGPFGRLPSARIGDLVEIHDGVRTSRYEVLDKHVVRKEEARDLAPSAQSILTLITCYPIGYVGPAPMRLVVRARLSDVAGAPAQPGR